MYVHMCLIGFWNIYNHLRPREDFYFDIKLWTNEVLRSSHLSEATASKGDYLYLLNLYKYAL